MQARFNQIDEYLCTIQFNLSLNRSYDVCVKAIIINKKHCKFFHYICKSISKSFSETIARKNRCGLATTERRKRDLMDNFMWDQYNPV